MSHPEYLFTRRSFLQAGSAAVAGLALAPSLRAKDEAPIRMGSGNQTYTLDPAWGKLPAGMNYGLGCAVVVDSQDRVFVTSRSANPCVAIFDKDGKLLETWAKDFGDGIGYTPQQIVATAHGLYWNKEADGEYLYWTENVAAPKGAPKIGARVYKTDLKGKVLYTVGNVEKESATSQKFNFTNPTDVAIAANGDIYVVDGYGSQLVHRFDKNFKLIKTIGGPGKEKGKFNVVHGVWINTLKKETEVYFADRVNNRIEIYSLDLEYKRTIPGVKLPCCFYQHDGKLFIPELGSRVTILDEHDKVMAHLGDGEGKKVDDLRKMPEKFAYPHAMTVDSKGNFYIVEWVADGRVRCFRPTPKA
jgi:hypothetical protein